MGAHLADDTLWQLHPAGIEDAVQQTLVPVAAAPEDAQVCPLCGHGTGDSEHVLPIRPDTP